MTEQEVRKKVKDLKDVYMDLGLYTLLNALFILIWFFFDTGSVFWPKYILLVWGIALVIKAYRKQVIPLILNHFSFFTPEWEEMKVDEILGHRHIQRKIHLKRDVK